jgi:PAS domain S-box-containing protein
MIPDMKTVMIMYAIINAVCAVFIAIVQHLNRRRFAGISFWLADMVLQSIGSILIILRGVVPGFISMTVSNVMIITGIFIIYIGLERFTGKKSFQIHNYILLVIFIVIQVYFTYVRSDLTARDFNISAITLILTFQCAWLMIRRVPKDMRQTTGITGLVFAGYAFISLIRIILLIVFPLKSSDFFKAGAPDTIIIILYTMLAAGLAFSLILMVNGRLVGDIRIYAQQRDNDALKLKERVREIHNYLDIAEVMILVINNEGKITLINRKGSEILGCKENKTIGKNWFDEFIPERLREEVKSVFNRMMAGKAKSLEYFENYVITCKGEERLIAWHNVLIKDSEGRITGTLSSGEDITEYKKAEKAQRESAEKFSKAFQTSPYAITITSIKDGKLIEVNDAFTTITGYTCEESVSSSSINLSLWADRENREWVVSALKEGVEVKDKEFQFRKKNGETIIGLFSAQIIHINNEPFILSSISDITERKRMEEKLLKVMEKYKSSNFELEQYANVASHDLQEPLRVISSYTMPMTL